MPIDLPPPTVCDHNCFLPPGHDGPHQAPEPMRPCPACKGTGEVPATAAWEQLVPAQTLHVIDGSQADG